MLLAQEICDQSCMMGRMIISDNRDLFGRHWRVANKLSEEVQYKFFARTCAHFITKSKILTLNLRVCSGIFFIDQKLISSSYSANNRSITPSLRLKREIYRYSIGPCASFQAAPYRQTCLVHEIDIMSRLQSEKILYKSFLLISDLVCSLKLCSHVKVDVSVLNVSPSIVKVKRRSAHSQSMSPSNVKYALCKCHGRLSGQFFWRGNIVN